MVILFSAFQRTALTTSDRRRDAEGPCNSQVDKLAVLTGLEELTLKHNPLAKQVLMQPYVCCCLPDLKVGCACLACLRHACCRQHSVSRPNEHAADMVAALSALHI